ncbi:fatty acyl-AMP ligase [Pseudonocardia kujensis]|uniref:fatty acyl-AMP ligase n=1 Tax=Pseudonocardia kujensis TaxID=1128675 RepID=UPI001E47EBD3|nr:fatty acyl-AMP ligase [Pseudonocardia kujensis]MCE0764882.1 fatty acyl-AMP ligase [Pseudonocardia kujensis]
MILPEVVARRAAETPRRTAYVFLDERGAETRVLTYAELHERAVGVAAALPCGPGERALLAFPQCPEFVIAFLGCLYAGVVAVPMNPPRRNRVQEATAAVVADSAPAAVLTLRSSLDALQETLPQVPAWVAVDEVGSAAGVPVARGPGDLAFLQYTSGSTSAPKGVMVSHGNLAANEDMIARAFGHDEGSTVVGWAPFFHDQGLIGNLVQPLWVGAQAILMSPMAFVRRPLLWLETVSRYRAHTSGGPNFAFDACVGAAARGTVPTLDLSCWKVAFNGAEPVRPDTLRTFTELFAPHGFDPAAMHPCYGLAEATLIVTGTGKLRGPRLLLADAEALETGRVARASAAPRVRELAGSGEVLPDESVRIVDPRTRHASAPGAVGEIWVSGPAVAQGYWRNPSATSETFRARIAGEPEEYLRTGDLGVIEDGELYVVGRIKDVAIIRGRNHHPQDVEHTVATAHPALQPGAGAAFAVPGPTGERLVVVQEVRREHRRAWDPQEVAGAVRAALAHEHGLTLAELVVTLPGRVPRTSSGKIRRAAAAAIHARDGFDRWSPSRHEDGMTVDKGASVLTDVEGA